MPVTYAMISFLLGMAITVAGGGMLWYFARQCRAATPPSVWSQEWFATTLALVLVGVFVVGGAWVLKAMMLVIPDAIAAIATGFLVIAITILATIRVLGGLPSESGLLGKPDNPGRAGEKVL